MTRILYGPGVQKCCRYTIDRFASDPSENESIDCHRCSAVLTFHQGMWYLDLVAKLRDSVANEMREATALRAEQMKGLLK